MISLGVHHLRLVLAVGFAFAFAAMCAVATYGYLAHRPRASVSLTGAR
jgi:hypothetical protein